VTQHVYRKQHVVTSVVAVIVDPDDRILLTRRAVAPFLGLWVMPGGKIDLGEPILRALHREVREEVGLEVSVEGLVDVFEHLTPGSDNDHFVILYYRCRPVTHAVVPNPHEVAEARCPRAHAAAKSGRAGTLFWRWCVAKRPSLRRPGNGVSSVRIAAARKVLARCRSGSLKAARQICSACAPSTSRWTGGLGSDGPQRASRSLCWTATRTGAARPPHRVFHAAATSEARGSTDDSKTTISSALSPRPRASPTGLMVEGSPDMANSRRSTSSRKGINSS
jgi:8-oxo-dGTP diphosphatase